MLRVHGFVIARKAGYHFILHSTSLVSKYLSFCLFRYNSFFIHLDIYYVHIHNKGNVRKKKARMISNFKRRGHDVNLNPRKNQNTCANVYIHT
jgi:hypothetical protein